MRQGRGVEKLIRVMAGGQARRPPENGRQAPGQARVIRLRISARPGPVIWGEFARGAGRLRGVRRFGARRLVAAALSIAKAACGEGRKS